MTGQADRWVDSSGHLAGGTIGLHDAVIGANDQRDVGNGVNDCLQEGPRRRIVSSICLCWMISALAVFFILAVFLVRVMVMARLDGQLLAAAHSLLVEVKHLGQGLVQSVLLPDQSRPCLA